MPFDRAFKLSSLLLAFAALAGLVLAHSTPWWLGIITALVLVLATLETVGYQFAHEILAQTAARSTIWNLLLIGAFLLFWIDLVLISRDLLSAGIHFLLILLVVKLCTLQERRDVRHLFAISLMAILASAALTTDVWFVLVFILYVLAAIWTLLLYHLTKVQDDRAIEPLLPGKTSASMALPNHVSGHFFWLTNGIALITFAMTLAIFFAIPRIGAGMFQNTRGNMLRTTGFSEHVDLGTIGAVKQDPQVVMRVELPDQPAVEKDRLYLRGVAYDRYNGRSWNNSAIHRRALSIGDDGTFFVVPNERRMATPPKDPLRQDILLEALDTSVLFAAPFAERLSGEFLAVQADAMGALHLAFPVSSRVRYSVTSEARTVSRDEQAASSLDYPESIRLRYLQLPEQSGKVVDLARDVAKQVTAPYAQVIAIQRHLLENYRYSLDADTASLRHPLDEFLFSRKTGYCEHYATAMVVMLRAVGIPARLVTGFLATEWNEYGGYFTVRQRDAHAWVEVYFPRSGWVTVDPTPVVGSILPPSRWTALQQFGESLRLYWDRLFVRYSARDQMAVVRGVREGSDALRDWTSAWVSTMTAPFVGRFDQLVRFIRSLKPGILESSIGLVALGLVVLLTRARHHLRLWATRHLPASRRQLVIAQLYVRMIQALSRQGLVKQATSTPAEFLKQVEREWAMAGPLVARITTLYQQGRFSQTPLTAEDLGQVAEQIGQLQALTRHIS